MVDPHGAGDGWVSATGLKGTSAADCLADCPADQPTHMRAPNHAPSAAPTALLVQRRLMPSLLVGWHVHCRWGIMGVMSKMASLEGLSPGLSVVVMKAPEFAYVLYSIVASCVPFR